MFAVIANSHRGDLREAISAMSAAFVGTTGHPRIWLDERKGVALTGCARGIQDEDCFDRQPYANERLVFVADGYLYDRHEAAEGLDLTPTDIGNMSDSELLFRAFQVHGKDLPEKIYGDFAFAAFLRASGEILVSDSHVATKGIYYALRDGALVAAGQMAAMLANPSIERKPNLIALPLLVAPKVVNDATSVENVHKLSGGRFLHFLPGNALSFEHWWHPEAIKAARYRKHIDYVEQARTVFAKAVSSCLAPRSGANTTLSGGLDSTLVAAVAAKQMEAKGRELTAYISVPELGLRGDQSSRWDHDESPLAEALASRHANVKLIYIRPDGQSCLGVLPENHRNSCTASRNITNQLWSQRMGKLTRSEGKRILLVGDRGNATASLEGRLVFSILFSSGRWLAMVRAAQRDKQRGGDLPGWKAFALELRSRLRAREDGMALRPGAPLLNEAFRKTHMNLLDEPASRYKGRRLQVDFVRRGNHFAGAELFHTSGVEERDPFADRRFMETVLSFPLEASLSGGRSRGLAREMGEGSVPDVIRLRRNRGAQVPEAAALIQKHAGGYERSLDVLRTSRACREVFDLHAAAEALDKLIAGHGRLLDAYTMDRLMDAGSLIQEWGY